MNRIFNQYQFKEILLRERKRTMRSGKPVILMTMDIQKVYGISKMRPDVDSIIGLLIVITRQSDIIGWLDNGYNLGVIFTEIGDMDVDIAKNKISEKITDTLSRFCEMDHTDDGATSFSIIQDANARNPAPNVPIKLKTLDMESGGRYSTGAMSSVLGALTRQRSFLLLCDILLILLARILGNNYFGQVPFFYQCKASDWFCGVGGFWPVLVLCLLSLYIFGLYDVVNRFLTVRSLVRRILWINALVGLGLLLFFFVHHDPPASRVALGLQTALASIFVSAFRLVYWANAHAANGKVGTLIIGAGSSGEAVFHHLNHFISPYEVKGFIDDDSAPQGKVTRSASGGGNFGQTN
ncbi:MAG: hypothetical protein P4N59_24390 [Negativicutes bacterium]|nr:hypothetical protein [Negativicutes bacterium]